MMESSSGKTDDARLLVMGYCGTLRPVQCQNFPPAMETLLEPWLAQASQRLNQHVCQQHRVFQGAPVPLESLLPLLKDRLIGILTQAVGVSGFASGDPTASDMLREFPLLQPLIRGAVCEWVEAIGTFLQRLHRDQSWLAASLRLVTLPPIQSISGAASDMHAGGHLVLRVCFQGGGCLYYKPRPLTGEWLWQRLLDAIVRLDPQLNLPASRVLPSDATSRYGWAESVRPEESRFCDSSDTTPAADCRLLARRRSDALPCATCPADRPAPREYHRHSLAGQPSPMQNVWQLQSFVIRPPKNLHNNQSPRLRYIGCDSRYRTSPQQTRFSPTRCLRLVRTRCTCLRRHASRVVGVIGRTVPAHFRRRGTCRPGQRTHPDHSHRSVAADVERLSPCCRAAPSRPRNPPRARLAMAFGSGKTARATHRASRHSHLWLSHQSVA